ncbi:hypothetical protein C8R43DRAFT_940753 [Mycena crocata]|nr:hypothetical protein C8R43DRAFT_940753 [Mycena crocata]
MGKRKKSEDKDAEEKAAKHRAASKRYYDRQVLRLRGLCQYTPRFVKRIGPACKKDALRPTGDRLAKKEYRRQWDQPRTAKPKLVRKARNKIAKEVEPEVDVLYSPTPSPSPPPPKRKRKIETPIQQCAVDLFDSDVLYSPTPSPSPPPPARQKKSRDADERDVFHETQSQHEAVAQTVLTKMYQRAEAPPAARKLKSLAEIDAYQSDDESQESSGRATPCPPGPRRRWALKQAKAKAEEHAAAREEAILEAERAARMHVHIDTSVSRETIYQYRGSSGVTNWLQNIFGSKSNV